MKLARGGRTPVRPRSPDAEPCPHAVRTRRERGPTPQLRHDRDSGPAHGSVATEGSGGKRRRGAPSGAPVPPRSARTTLGRGVVGRPGAPVALLGGPTRAPDHRSSCSPSPPRPARYGASSPREARAAHPGMAHARHRPPPRRARTPQRVAGLPHRQRAGVPGALRLHRRAGGDGAHRRCGGEHGPDRRGRAARGPRRAQAAPRGARTPERHRRGAAGGEHGPVPRLLPSDAAPAGAQRGGASAAA